MWDNCLTTTETKRFGGDVERSVGEHAAESSQPCRKGSNHDRTLALEAVYEGCRVNDKNICDGYFIT